MEKKKRQRVYYSQEALEFIRNNYGEIGMYNMQQGLKKITGKLITYNAISIKARRMGLDTMQEARTYILIKDLNECLNTTQGSRYVREGKLGKKVTGLNGTAVNIEKFWKWAERTNIDLTGYQRGTLLPEPKADKSGRSWLDRRIAKQVTEKYNRDIWDDMKVAKLKRIIEQDKMTRREMAKYFGVTVGQINHQVVKQNLTKGVRLKVTEKEREEVIRLYKEGYTVAEIMQMYSRCRKTIRNIIKRMYADEKGEIIKA